MFSSNLLRVTCENKRTKNFRWLLQIEYFPENDPLIAMAHGTSVVSVNYDSPTRVKDALALETLRKSCSDCSQEAIISRGPQFRKSVSSEFKIIDKVTVWNFQRVLPLRYPSALRGMISEVKYFDCERDHSRPAVLKKLASYFQEENQYAG